MKYVYHYVSMDLEMNWDMITYVNRSGNELGHILSIDMITYVNILSIGLFFMP